MVVLNLINCPISLRGHITKWLVEISSGVYVGNINKRVRDALWRYIKDTCRNGRATLVYTTNNEQRYDFKVFGDVWEPIDYDGLKLILRPNVSRIEKQQKPAAHGFSNAATHRKTKKHSTINKNYPKDYIILDMLASENDSENDDISDIIALKIIGNEIIDTFYSDIKNFNNDFHNKTDTITDPGSNAGSEPICHIANSDTGDELAYNAEVCDRDIRNTILTLQKFIGSMPMVVFNEKLNIKILQNICIEYDIPLFLNRCIDVQVLAQRLMDNINFDDPDNTLFNPDQTINTTQSLPVRCEKTKSLYEKLTK